MKKLFFFAATAAIALSSCSSDDLAQAPVAGPEVNDGAVQFSAYMGRQTRAALETTSTVKAKGFGVFAYDQGNVAWATYSASNTQPNFFYNQKVAYDNTTYTPNTVANLAAWMALTDATVQNWYEGTVKVSTSSVFTDAEKTELEALGGTWTTGWSGTDPSITAPTGATLTLDQYKALTTSALQAKFELEGSITVKSAFASFDTDGFIALSATAQSNVTGDGTKWVYAPVKYYNNNEGAKHSFFAYAPYKSDVKAVFALTKAPQIRYAMGVDDYDLMWGKYWNDTQAVPTKNTDVEKPSITNTISFDFQHALSCVSIEAVPFIDEVHTGTDHGTDPSDDADHDEFGVLAAGTTVTLRSVKFIADGGTALPSQGLLNLENGLWTVEGTDEGAYEMTTATEWTAGTPVLKPIVNNKMIIPAAPAPTGSSVKVQVVYDVTTIDPTDPKNNSTITNTITSATAYTLLPGTAYMFHLDLGLTSVKFTAMVTDWNNSSYEVDLPNNKN